MHDKRSLVFIAAVSVLFFTRLLLDSSALWYLSLPFVRTCNQIFHWISLVSLSGLQILHSILLLSVSMVFLKVLASILRIYMAAYSYKDTNGSSIDVQEKRIRIIINSKPLAYVGGILHPKIYVSTGLYEVLNGDELDAVISHEQFHLRHHHSRWLFLVHLIMPLNIVFPVFNFLCKHIEYSFEKSADVFASDAVSERALASAYAKLFPYGSTKQPLAIHFLQRPKPSFSISSFVFASVQSFTIVMILFVGIVSQSAVEATTACSVNSKAHQDFQTALDERGFSPAWNFSPVI